MKKLFFIIVIFFFANITFVNAQTACPFGQVNDPFPGLCAHYIDIDNNGFCDLSQTKQVDPARDYNLLPISFALIVLYLSGLTLVKAQKLSRFSHRKIWNIILALSFLGSAIPGLILVLHLNYKIPPTINPKIMFLHVEFSIVFTVVAIFHTFWHLPYFKRLFRK